ncbi:MAG: calcium/sodium antiporter [Betaproteobacteria bacterium]|nr:MAG: calcium/sodium antiporter [Betaproteobacteria bacterium]
MDPLAIVANSLGGLAALYFGARWLVGAASDVARRLGVSPLLIGLTVVAVGTSLPELFVGVAASIGGHAGVSLGNVIGANALNIGLILGVAALIRPIVVSLRVLQWDLPVMFAATALLAWFSADGEVTRGEAVILLAAMLAYLGLNIAAGRRERKASALAGALEVPHAASLAGDLARGAVGAAALAIGARLLIDGALGLAAALGLAEGLVGMTLVAVGTTLPELVTTLVAAARRQGDLAFGNIVGSNINNALTVVGAAAAVAPLAAGDVARAPMYALLALTLLAAPVMWRGFVINRWEGGLLVCGYAAFLWVGLGG